MDTQRIRVKIGTHEFDAEGPTELVTSQYQSFITAISSMAAPAAPVQSIAPPLAPPPQNPPPLANGVGREVLDRVFMEGDTLSLAALPSGDNAAPNALLALIYGYHRVRGEQSVTGTSLMKSAKKSGVPVERADRVLAIYMPEFVLAAGVKKARRYQLNNRGLARAEEIIKAIVQ